MKKECVRCGECCKDISDIFLSEEEALRIIDFCEANGINHKNKIVNWSQISEDYWEDYWVLEPRGDSDRCPFLRKVKGENIYKCGINEVKPKLCFNYSPGKCSGYLRRAS
jgi:Fe-S-cluster containining protein